MLLGMRGVSTSAQDPRLEARLDPQTRVAVAAIIDSARRAKLPTAPLTDKALEGWAKGIDGPKIVVAVRQFSGRLADARRTLGAASSADEIKAGAVALDAGVAARDIARLRTAAGKRTLTLSLAVLTDLVVRDVPVATASNLVVSLARSHVHDADLTLFQRNVRLDIERGADPSTAASTRARGLILKTDSAAGSNPTAK
jgi:hypothetical protein